MRHIFIINNFLTKENTSKRIRDYLSELQDFEYLVFDTEYPLHEKAIATKMCELFSDEQIRFYICGGSGTFANVVSGVLDMDKVEFAFCPIGISCDFLKCFSGGRSPFSDLEKMIHGKVVSVDYMQASGGIRAVNTFSVGFDAKVVSNLRLFRPLSLWYGKGTYMCAIIKTLFEYRGLKLEVIVDGEAYTGKYMWVYIGNGRCCGSRFYPMKDVTPDDGLLNIFLLKKTGMLQFMFHMAHIKSGNIDKLGDKVFVCTGKNVLIRQLNGKPLMYDYDGDVQKYGEQSVKVVPGGMKFVIPWGTKIKNI